MRRECLMKIEQDVARFQKIIKGHIKRELTKFISQGDLVITQKGQKSCHVTLPRIYIPQFRFGENETQGIGRGQADAPLGKLLEEEGDDEGGQKPSLEEGSHTLELEIDLDFMADLLKEELELPLVLDKGQKSLQSEQAKYSHIVKQGPESLFDFKRTYKQALLRQISSNTYDATDPLIVPLAEDKRYFSVNEVKKPEASAVIFYMMDVSGSMGEEQKEIVRLTSFWINIWIKAHYKNLDTRFIVHDAQAKEVDEHTFFHTKESGGTLISSAYYLCQDIIAKHYDPNDWNIYLFHFSDGDNWSVQDTEISLSLLERFLLPKVNLFCYGQVESRYGSGQFLKEIYNHPKINDNSKALKTEIKARGDIPKAIKSFLGKGLSR
jgi:uncharacterized sporulation protein YeaH/YhbH (DUF444 family)